MTFVIAAPIVVGFAVAAWIAHTTLTHAETTWRDNGIRRLEAWANHPANHGRNTR